MFPNTWGFQFSCYGHWTSTDHLLYMRRKGEDIHVFCYKLKISHHQLQEGSLDSMKKSQGGYIKINFDKSKTLLGVKGGFIICNRKGRFIQASSFNPEASLLLVAEGRIMRKTTSNSNSGMFYRYSYRIITKFSSKQCKVEFKPHGEFKSCSEYYYVFPTSQQCHYYSYF